MRVVIKAVGPMTCIMAAWMVDRSAVAVPPRRPRGFRVGRHIRCQLTDVTEWVERQIENTDQ